MKINKEIFRGYDLRGVVDKDLNPKIVEVLGKAYGTYMVRHKVGRKAVVGYDCRLSSPEYSKALIKGIISTGINVFDIGLTLTGTFYWAQYYLKSNGGVMVTASHNPSEYNGFKFATNLSETMVSDEIQELRKIAESGDFIIAEHGGKVEEKNVKEVYFDDLTKRFDIKKKFKIVVDCSCGTPGAFVPELLRKMGNKVIENNCKLDGTFPVGTPDPTERAVAERLAKKVIETKADIGFSYDADGDRIGLVDEKGNILWNDILVALFAADVIDQNPGAKIVYNTLCSKVVDDIIKEKGGQSIICRTGHSFIKAKAQKEKAKFAGELSGHFFFLDKFYPHDDGCYAALRILDYLLRTKQALSQAVALLPEYISSAEIKVGCSDDKKVKLMDKAAVALRKDFSDAEIIDDERAGDGVRLEMDDAMFVIRYSQNGPYLTVKFEAMAQEKYDELRKYIKKLLHSYDEVDWNFGVNVESLEK